MARRLPPAIGSTIFCLCTYLLVLHGSLIVAKKRPLLRSLRSGIQHGVCMHDLVRDPLTDNTDSGLEKNGKHRTHYIIE